MTHDGGKLFIDGLPGPSDLRALRELIEAPATSETKMQQFFRDHPRVLAPLEFAECVRELGLPRRSLDQIRYKDERRQRRVDFAGVRLFPLDTPVILEMKGPHDLILDGSALELSDAAREVISQVRRDVMHVFVEDGLHAFTGKAWDITGIAEPGLVEEIRRLGPGSTKDEKVTALINSVRQVGVVPVALIGHTEEFEGNDDLFDSSREAFLNQGVSLFTYDELMLWNELLVDYAASDQSLAHYFNERKSIRDHDGTFMRFPEGGLFRKDVLRELQHVIVRTQEDVCLFGRGNPPPYAENGAWRAPMHFDVTKVLNPPKWFVGEEELIWAGRFQGEWIVVKRRHSEPLKGEIIWYYFNHPIESVVL